MILLFHTEIMILLFHTEIMILLFHTEITEITEMGYARHAA